MSIANLAKHLQQFFIGRLHNQLGASRHTVASYRDIFRLLLKFAAKHYHRQASDLRVEDLDAKLVILMSRDHHLLVACGLLQLLPKLI